MRPHTDTYVLFGSGSPSEQLLYFVIHCFAANEPETNPVDQASCGTADQRQFVDGHQGHQETGLLCGVNIC